MDSTLKKAKKLYSDKRYSEVIRLLEPQIYRFRDVYDFYFLLGSSCLHSKDLGGAYTYLKRAIQLDENSIQAMLALALVHLLKKETEESIKCWFDVLDKDQKNSQAKYGLEYLRKHVASNDPSFSLEDFRSFNKFIPEKTKFMPIITITAVVPLAAAITIFILLPFVRNILSKEPREGINPITLSSLNEIVDNREPTTIIMKEKEIKEFYRKALDYFQNYRDNLAQREINRLMLANASREIKNQLLLLSKYIKTPSFETFKDNFTYQEVYQNPKLYENCFILWKGKLSNISKENLEIQADFLVGYHDQKVLEGIIPISIPFAVSLDPYFGYEILAKINLKNNSISLTVISLHQLAP